MIPLHYMRRNMRRQRSPCNEGDIVPAYTFHWASAEARNIADSFAQRPYFCFGTHGLARGCGFVFCLRHSAIFTATLRHCDARCFDRDMKLTHHRHAG